MSDPMPEVERHDAEAQAAWDNDPKEGFRRYGLPCWCGHYGGCAKCEALDSDDQEARRG